MPIRYKVIKISYFTDKRISCFAEGKYSRNYTKGRTVKASPSTLGIMVFDTEENAKRFICNPNYGLRIIRVNPIGRGKRPKYISKYFESDRLSYFYTSKDFRLEASPPLGTICYPAVKVLE